MGLLNFMDWLKKPSLTKKMSEDSVFLIGTKVEEDYAMGGITLAQLTSSIQTLSIPKLHIHVENTNQLGVTLMPTATSTLWAEMNPRIYLFHYKKAKGGRKRKGGKGSKTSRYYKGGFLHPTHMNGVNFTNSRFYSGVTDIPYHTEFPITITKGYEREMLYDFNPFEFYNYANSDKGYYYKPLVRGLNASELNMVNVNGSGINTTKKAKRSKYFRFAIGIENPDPNADFPIIFGEMSDIVQSVVFVNNQNMVDIRLNVVPNGIKRSIPSTDGAK
jgi:hypothetical protein